MRFYFLFFFIFQFSFSQDDYNEINSYELINDHNYIEIDNIGDPLLFLTPLQNKSLIVTHLSNNIRLIDYFDGLLSSDIDSIYSVIIYQTNHKDGGTIKSLLSRPLSQYHKFKFSLTNLSSQGFYQNQHNKYNNMYLYIDYLDLHKPYSYAMYFLSNNGNYYHNGGIENYSTTVSPDLLTTYLDNANTRLKRRIFNFNHRFKLTETNTLEHNFKFSSFNRLFSDLGTQSYLYDLFNYSNNEFYQNETKINSFHTDFSLNTHYVNLGLSHYLYQTNIFNLNTFYDIIVSAHTIRQLNNDNNFVLKLKYCPVGLNSNDYNINININNQFHNVINNIEFMLSLNKPYLYTNYMDLDNLTHWLDLESSRVFSLKISSESLDKDINAHIELNRYKNYFYFDEFSVPNQYADPINYINFHISKKWAFNKFIFYSTMCIQTASSDIMLFPLFFTFNKLTYKNKISENISINASLISRIFTQYDQPNFSPLLDIFYNQSQVMSNFRPFISSDVHLNMKNFSFGLIFDNVHSLFFEDSYIISNYYHINPVIRLSIKWDLFN
jgi:hypothetical protein